MEVRPSGSTTPARRTDPDCRNHMTQTLLDALKTRVLLGDGAMGTQLMLAGLEQGACGEAWNVTHPDRVLAIQRRYAEAGSDCILTNTFGGSRIMLTRHGHGDEVAPVNRAAVEIDCGSCDGRPVFVIGVIGTIASRLYNYVVLKASDIRGPYIE